MNKKAFEQYNTFTKQRDGLLERREELDISGESIQDLIETLDTRKDEAIERTFKEVSKYFSETFEKLVPAGRGKLKMLKRHLMTHYNLTPEQYRAKWNLPADYPMVAPNYAEQRRTLAKKIGLGTKRKRTGRK